MLECFIRVSFYLKILLKLDNWHNIIVLIFFFKSYYLKQKHSTMKNVAFQSVAKDAKNFEAVYLEAL